VFFFFFLSNSLSQLKSTGRFIKIKKTTNKFVQKAQP